MDTAASAVFSGVARSAWK